MAGFNNHDGPIDIPVLDLVTLSKRDHFLEVAQRPNITIEVSVTPGIYN